MSEPMSLAEEASQSALKEVYKALDENECFRLEAGAGAGKTYSLVKSLQYLIAKHQRPMRRRGQKIACITFTNVAKDEIEARIDRSPVVLCDTNHGFCWSLIGTFQKHLRALVSELQVWEERLAEVNGIGERTVEYSLGHRSVKDGHVSLHHDDVLPLTIKLMENVKFRRLVTGRFPIILVDEYQDTNAAWAEAIKVHFIGQSNAPLFGFFGDHWQKIYGEGCGKLEHPSIRPIGKKANFRSVISIVDVLNRMRPDLPQFVVDPDDIGDVRVFHTNAWTGVRQKGQHWGGALPSAVASDALNRVKQKLAENGWDLSARNTKILMLTHRVLAAEQGYSTLLSTFRFNDSMLKKEHPHIAFLVDQLEPACDAFADHQFGAMFEALGGSVPLLRSSRDKVAWRTSMQALGEIRTGGTIGQVLAHLRKSNLPRLPDSVEDGERELDKFDKASTEPMPPHLEELEKLREVSYAEIKALRKYLNGHSPFETKHGVKGAEFENVLVVVGRGWNRYNFSEMLDFANAEAVPAAKVEAFERSRNLFYVACSRPKRRLAVLFTQALSPGALVTVNKWFGAKNIFSLDLT